MHKTRHHIVFGLLLVVLSCGKAKKEPSPDNTTTRNSIPEAKVQIIGSSPFWSKDNNSLYKYELVTGVALQPYKIDAESGGILNTSSQNISKTTRVADSAKVNSTKTYMTVTNYGAANIRRFLKNARAQEKAAIDLTTLLNDHDADGIILDFDGISRSDGQEFTGFIKSLSEHLNPLDKTLIITIPAHPLDALSYDFSEIDRFVAYYIVKTHNYSKRSTAFAEPLDPLFTGHYWNLRSVENTVNFYTNGKISSEKLILTIPYYGIKWVIENHDLPAKKIAIEETMTYTEIVTTYPKRTQYDSSSQSAFINLVERGKNMQLWYDDRTTIKAKYQFVLENKLGGVYIWALDNDNGHADLWQLLEDTLWD